DLCSRRHRARYGRPPTASGRSCAPLPYRRPRRIPQQRRSPDVEDLPGLASTGIPSVGDRWLPSGCLLVALAFSDLTTEARQHGISDGIALQLITQMLRRRSTLRRTSALSNRFQFSTGTHGAPEHLAPFGLVFFQRVATFDHAGEISIGSRKTNAE